ncbi:phosphoketolase family protein [Patescibacteria group bacterium]|nr:phosphoketolase family protein [Patescibacteria group bacterium]MBU1703329.1 phosphoketolase family protein [Patescibacteria group bacterium]MBU1954361.1 phosphoketolase family protein [Patescibacteria group bacterium]
MAKQSHQKAVKWLEKYLRYVDYLGTAQLYLKDNQLLQRELSQKDMKERVLGHWGTVPGQNFIYAHLNYLISKHKCSMYFVAGPGHGAPAVLANLFAEGTLGDFFKDKKRDKKGTCSLIKKFSWPGGFPSHTNPGTPGSICEGGELGYSLATAYGSVMDNPDLISACVIGDGEAETGPLAAAWHSNKYLDPKTCGAVLPILHANGYKITSPTIYASMSDKELKDLFSGFGYDVKIVNDTKSGMHNHEEMIETLEWAYQQIRKIQKEARTRKPQPLKPLWPMIVYRSLKGWGGIKEIDGKKIEGLFHSHGIPVKDPGTNPEHFKLVKDWLESYKIGELIDENGKPKPEVLTFVPGGNLRMGKNKHTYGGSVRKALHLPNPKDYEVDCNVKGCQAMASNTTIASKYFRDILKLNKKEKNFRFFCPDETESNKFNSLFEVTKRAFMWPIKPYDENLAPDGRVMEVLSEHTLMGWLQGYLLTGRHGFFATYEAFAMIIASMVDQYAKFVKQAMKFKWHKPYSSLNFLLTSVGWRQEHNGYSHQNPSFVSNVLEKHGKFCSVYFPADSNSLNVILEDCLKRTNSINLIVAGKQLMPQWLSVAQASEELKAGIGIWDWIDKTASKNPDVVFAASGDVMVQESMAAISILKKDIPKLKIRFVNVSELTALGLGDEKNPLLKQKKFDKYFTTTKPVIYNFHGYIGAIRNLIFPYKGNHRFSIHGYLEEGTTTTPFDMMVRNRTSRYDLMIDALGQFCAQNKKLAKEGHALIAIYKAVLEKHHKYIRKYGKDIPEVEQWHWGK